MLIIENIIFGVNTELTGNQEAIVNVEAEILAPLNLEVKNHVDFGKVVQGQTKNLENQGQLEITGTPKSKIKVFLKGSSEEKYRVTNKCKILLTKGGVQTTEENKKMIANLELDKEIEKIFLNSEGKVVINIGGSVTANSDPGEYKGEMCVRVEYDGVIN